MYLCRRDNAYLATSMPFLVAVKTKGTKRRRRSGYGESESEDTDSESYEDCKSSGVQVAFHLFSVFKMLSSGG